MNLDRRQNQLATLEGLQGCKSCGMAGIFDDFLEYAGDSANDILETLKEQIGDNVDGLASKQILPYIKEACEKTCPEVIVNYTNDDYLAIIDSKINGFNASIIDGSKSQDDVETLYAEIIATVCSTGKQTLVDSPEVANPEKPSDNKGIMYVGGGALVGYLIGGKITGALIGAGAGLVANSMANKKEQEAN